MEGVNPKEVEVVLSKIEDGFIFEKFASSFLSSILGYNFIPHGGIKDRGIDGLQHTYSRENYDKLIYQFSIEKEPQHKLMSTLAKLKENDIDYGQLTFVTNQFFKDKAKITDEAFDKF